ncbi:glycosyltransferase family 2 protein [Enterobacter cloacae complex sp. 304I2]|uniref:glycosyltransferase family 2 protein n=1 Tax=Enterobacter cloacae complex sp. 304I2 TaxID=3395829 RepID=UPI003CF87753
MRLKKMFTVVITTKDRKSYLLRAVQSIVNSSILPYDIVIVNDGGIEIAEQDLPPSSIKYIIINNKASKGQLFQKSWYRYGRNKFNFFIR